MDLRFYSLTRAPRSLPIWHAILADLGNPHPRQVAKVLGVGIRTVYRWNRTGNAPRAAALALFWLTRWGHSAVHTQAVNDAILAAQLAASLRRELDSVRVEFDRVMALSNTGAADGSYLKG
jgi:hypothetical protein